MVIFRTVFGPNRANCSPFIEIAALLWASKFGGKDASGRFLPLDIDGCVDLGWLGQTLSDIATWMLTRPFLQTSGPVQIRDYTTIPGSNFHASTET